ncbi:unnamed protein product [Parajaminaea phylloscopi]
MTTFTLAAFKDRKLPGPEAECTFCQIASGAQRAHIVYSDDAVIAFLDVLPIRTGHVLVVPRRHVDNLAALDVSVNSGGGGGGSGEGEDVMRALVRVTRAVGRALHDDRLQVITNQGYAQVVPHSSPDRQKRKTKTKQSSLPSAAINSGAANLLMLAGHGRNELDDDEGIELAQRIKAALDDDARSRDSVGEEHERTSAGATQRARSKL